MAYHGRTQLMSLPYPVEGDVLNEGDNGVSLSLSEGFCLAGTSAYGGCIFQVGRISFEQEDDLCWRMKISPAEDGLFSLVGFSNGVFFFSHDEIVLPQTMTAMNMYYVYVSCDNFSYGGQEDFIFETYSERLPDEFQERLVCVVSTADEETDFEPSVVEVGGESTAATAAAGHFGSHSNPHGSVLTQENAIIGNPVECESGGVIGGCEYGNFSTVASGVSEIPLVGISEVPRCISAYPETAEVESIHCSCDNGVLRFQYSPAVVGAVINYKLSF